MHIRMYNMIKQQKFINQQIYTNIKQQQNVTETTRRMDLQHEITRRENKLLQQIENYNTKKKSKEKYHKSKAKVHTSTKTETNGKINTRRTKNGSKI